MSCISTLALRLISPVCPIFSLNPISNFSWVRGLCGYACGGPSASNWRAQGPCLSCGCICQRVIASDYLAGLADE